LYLYLESEATHTLLILLDKNEQEDINEEQRKQLRNCLAQVKKDAGG